MQTKKLNVDEPEVESERKVENGIPGVLWGFKEGAKIDGLGKEAEENLMEATKSYFLTLRRSLPYRRPLEFSNLQPTLYFPYLK